MKILKHGDLKPRKFICKDCGCEFVADAREYGSYGSNRVIICWYADCPECDARTTVSEPWEEQDDTERN